MKIIKVEVVTQEVSIEVHAGKVGWLWIRTLAALSPGRITMHLLRV